VFGSGLMQEQKLADFSQMRRLLTMGGMASALATSCNRREDERRTLNFVGRCRSDLELYQGTQAHVVDVAFTGIILIPHHGGPLELKTNAQRLRRLEFEADASTGVNFAR
jgi:hypothetical protein